MKKYINLIIAAGLILLATSCGNNAQKRLAATATQLNAELPMNLGNGVEMDSVAYDNTENTFNFYYSLSEDFNSISSMRSAHDAQRRFLRTYLSGQEGNEFTKFIVDADANIRLNYYGKKSQDSVSLTFYSNEIKELLENQEEANDDRSQLANLIAVTNAQCPLHIDGDDLVMTGIALEESDILFSYTYNPEEYEFSADNLDEFKAALLPELRNELTAPANTLQLKLMKKLGIGVSYLFEAEGREPLSFGFTPEQIKEL